MAKITFYGAAKTVTGSCFLLEDAGVRVLIDCGMFMGLGVEKRNIPALKFDPRTIDFVLLTHAHLDHCGLLPKLYREGFSGLTYVTPPTRFIAEQILLDSAKVQEIRAMEDKNLYRRGKREKNIVIEKGDNTAPIVIYDTRNVLTVLDKMAVVKYGKTMINKGVKFKFLRTRHALGASSIWIKVGDSEFLFSGDMGNKQQRLDSTIDYPSSADYVVMESLYGGREHKDRKMEEKELVELINTTLARGGNVLIPSFTLQRTQEVLYMLKRFFEGKRILRDTRVYIDSPLAIRVTEIYKKYFTYLGKDVISQYRDGNDLFTHNRFVYIRNAKQSRKIRQKRGSIIIAGHGMCAGGRIVSHLLSNLADKRSSILFVGFQANGTLGREIVDGAKSVMVEDVPLKVKATIKRFFSFSAHAGHSELMEWVKHLDKSKLKKIFLVHAEPKRSEAFKKALANENIDSIIPEWLETVEV